MGQAGEDVLPLVVRPEDEGRREAVAVAEESSLAHAGDVAALLGGAGHAGVSQGLFRVAVRGDAQAVIALVASSGRAVRRHQLPLLVQLGRALAVRLIPDVRVRLFGVLDGGIDDLELVLVLPGLQRFVFAGREGHVHHAHGGVVVHPQIVIGGLLAAGGVCPAGGVGLHDGVYAGLFLNRLQGGIAGGVHGLVAAAVLAEKPEGHLRRELGVGEIQRIREPAGIGVFEEKGHEQRVEHDQQDDEGRDHGAFIPRETIHGVGKVSVRLGLRRFVVVQLAPGDVDELFRRDSRNFVAVLCHFLLPILIRGSMRP